MDNYGRRGRRRRGRSRTNIPVNIRSSPSPCHTKPWCFLSGFYSIFIMASLISIIYLMLEYHCNSCTAKSHLNSISRNIDEISQNLSVIRQSYHDLELKLSKFSQQLPKIEGQIEILEALANTIEGRDFGWDPKTHLTLPNVDVYLTKLENGKNISQKCSKHMQEVIV